MSRALESARVTPLRCAALAAFALGALLAGDPGRAEPTDAGANATGSEASVARPLRDATLDVLLSGDTERTGAALAGLRASPDIRYSGALIELLRALEIGLVGGLEPEPLIATLEIISGAAHGADWSAWVRWLARTPIEAPPGFTGWKGQLLGRIDPRFAALLAYGVPTRIRVEEIVWGGVPFEGIPSLDAPKTVPASEAVGLDDADAVFGVVIGEAARAWPLRILDWHEMSNDTLGGVPIALAYCTLCGSGIAYDRRAGNDPPHHFGSSGLLMRSNKLMVDRATHSLWNQFNGEPVVGALAEGPAFRLPIVPNVVTTWGRWKARHPNTDVVSFDTGFARPYEPGAAYADYFASDETMFPVPETRGAGPHASAPSAKARVVGVERAGHALSVPLEMLLRERVYNASVGGDAIVLIVSSEAVMITGRSLRSGVERRYSAGAEVRAYLRGPHRFRAAPAGADADGDGEAVIDERGVRWILGEDALVAPDGTRLERIPSVLAYRFGWSSFHPESAASDSTESGSGVAP